LRNQEGKIRNINNVRSRRRRRRRIRVRFNILQNFNRRGLALGDVTKVFRASFNSEMGKYCSCVMVEIRKYQSLRVTSLGTSPRPNGLGIIAGFGSRITLLKSKNFCETITPFMSLLLVRVSRGPLCTYPSTLCVYHVPNHILED
jgi:hypothetical protein